MIDFASPATRRKRRRPLSTFGTRAEAGGHVSADGGWLRHIEDGAGAHTRRQLQRSAGEPRGCGVETVSVKVHVWYKAPDRCCAGEAPEGAKEGAHRAACAQRVIG